MDKSRSRRTRVASAVAGVALLAGAVFASFNPTRTAQAGSTWRSLGEPGFASVLNAVSIDPRDSRHLLLGGEMNGVSSSTDSGETFLPSIGLEDYEVGSFTWHPANPNEVWVGTMGGLYRSTDSGRTWSPVRNGFPSRKATCYSAPVERVVFDPNNAAHLLALGGSQRDWNNSCDTDRSAVWESTDSGSNWIRKSEVAHGVLGSAGGFVAGSSRELIVTTRGAGALRSDDGGRTWQAGTGLPHGNAVDIALHPSQPAVAWLTLEVGDHGQSGGVYKTVDGGRTWQIAMNGLSSEQNGYWPMRSRYEEIQVATTDPNVLYVSDVGWPVKLLYRSTDGGASWVSVTSGFPSARSYQAGNEGYALAIDPRNAAHVLLGNMELAFQTFDSGRTWTNLGERGTSGVGVRNRGASFVVGNAVHFNPFVAGQVALSGMDGSNLFWSDDNTASWRRPLQTWDPWGGSTDAVFASSHDVYVLMGQSGVFNGIAASHDGGATWKVAVGQGQGLPERYAASDITPAALTASGTAVFASIAGVVYRSTNGGDSWATTGGLTDVMDLTTNPITKEIVAVGRSGVAVSSNAGSSFQALANSPSGTKVHVDSQGRIIVVDWRGTGAWRLSGATWRQLRTDRLTFDVVADPTNPTRLVAVTNDHPWHDDAGASGVWVSYDDGATWNTRNDGLPMTRAAAVAFDPFAAGRVVVGTYGAGYWETQLESTPPPTTTTTTTTPTTSRPATTSSSSNTSTSSTSTNSTTTTTTQDGHPRSLPVSPILIEAMGAALRRQGIDTQR